MLSSKRNFIVPVGGSKLQITFTAFSSVEGNAFLTFNQDLDDSTHLNCS